MLALFSSVAVGVVGDGSCGCLFGAFTSVGIGLVGGDDGGFLF